MAFQLTSQQQQAVSERGGGLLVSAAAGSGKTRVLVERLLGRVEEGQDLDRFLVITYTKAAAAELRERIGGELSDRIASRPGDAVLRRQATLLYKTQISTIDAFCTALLREEGHRLDLDHDFRVCDEQEALIFMGEAINTVLEGRYEALREGDDFALLVDTMSAGRDDSRLVQIVLDIRGRVQSHPDPDRWLREQEEAFALSGVTDVGETPWGRLLLEDVHGQALYWRDQMAQALELCQTGDAALEKYGISIQVTLDALESLVHAGTSWDETMGALSIPFETVRGARGCEYPEVLEQVKALRSQCKDQMAKLQAALSTPSAELMEDMGAVYPAIRALFALVRDFEGEFSALKRKRGVLDFSDLEHFAVKLLVDETGAPTALARRWGERYEEVMVDEYQDTNAVQNAIFTALTNGGDNLFMVGDVKQSIYRFRLADPTIFLQKYQEYIPWQQAGPGDRRRVLLSQNFRSRPQVLEGVNYLFRSIMSRQFGEMDYTDEDALVPGGTFPEVEGDPYALELDLLDCGGAAEEEGPKPSQNLLEARWVAQRVRQLLDEKFPVSDGEGGTRPVEPGDVVILLRSPGTVRHHYAQALGELDIPWSAEGAGDFFAATEIQVALSLLKVIDNPRQDVPLIATLRSALYGFSADRLSRIRTAAPEADFYTALTLDGGEDTQAFLKELDQLRSWAGEESGERLLWRVYDRTNLLGIFANLDEGETRRANLLLLAQLARSFEQGGHKGLFGFLSYLQRLRDSGQGVNLPAPAANGGSVRVMSIHRSKGLEFPVVILAGLARRLNRQDMNQPILFHPQLGVGPKRLELERMLEYPTLARMAVSLQLDRELRSEELRLLYVAMTRAKEKLILSCAFPRPKAVEELAAFAGSPVHPQALQDRSSLAQWVLLAALARPEGAALLESGLQPPVAPGTDFGPGWVIRWQDCAGLGKAPAGRQRMQETERRDGKDWSEDLTALYTWQYPHAGDVELPSKLTATQLKGRGLDQEAAEEGEELAKPAATARFDRPRFAAERLGLTPAQKGTAHHLAMQYLDFTRTGSLEEIQDELKRLVDQGFLTPEQGQAVDGEKLLAFFRSDLGREMMAAPLLRREFKFSILAPAGRYFPAAGEEEQVLLQGVVDACFETGEGLTVVDFKTDHVYGPALLERAEDYRPQLAAYGQALEEITGRPVVRRVLWFFSEGRAVEV